MFTALLFSLDLPVIGLIFIFAAVMSQFIFRYTKKFLLKNNVYSRNKSNKWLTEFLAFTLLSLIVIGSFSLFIRFTRDIHPHKSNMHTLHQLKK